MTMTRQHFTAIAETIRGLNLTDADRNHVAGEFSELLARTNAAFDGARFLTACGVPE